MYPFKVDVFSFGMVLYELASGKIPWKELELNSMIMRYTIEGTRPKLPEDIPTQYEDLVKKCWEEDPTKRPPFADLAPTFQQLDIHGPQLSIKSTALY
jgi:serine/threonine protein kinase